MFVCEFASKDDKSHLLRQNPWYYDRQLIVFGEFRRDEQPSDVVLNSSLLWVCLCNLPLNKGERDSLMKIRYKIGEPLNSSNYQKSYRFIMKGLPLVQTLY